MSEESKSTTVAPDTTGKVAESSKESTEDKEVANGAEEKKDDKSPVKVPANFDFRALCTRVKLECHKCHSEFEVCATHYYQPLHPEYKFLCGC